MKIKLDFVTNSSSSSFIISMKEETCSHCGRKNKLLELGEIDHYYDHYEISEDPTRVEDFLQWQDPNRIKEFKKQIQKEISDGKKIYYIEVNNHSPIVEMITNDCSVKIIARDEA